MGLPIDGDGFVDASKVDQVLRVLGDAGGFPDEDKKVVAGEDAERTTPWYKVKELDTDEKVYDFDGARAKLKEWGLCDVMNLPRNLKPEDMSVPYALRLVHFRPANSQADFPWSYHLWFGQPQWIGHRQERIVLDPDYALEDIEEWAVGLGYGIYGSAYIKHGDQVTGEVNTHVDVTYFRFGEWIAPHKLRWDKKVAAKAVASRRAARLEFHYRLRSYKKKGHEDTASRATPSEVHVQSPLDFIASDGENSDDEDVYLGVSNGMQGGMYKIHAPSLGVPPKVDKPSLENADSMSVERRETHDHVTRLSGPASPFTYTRSHAVLFPGQGAQKVGMGIDMASSCPAAASVFAKATELVGWDVLEVCRNGPSELLARTDVAQVAIFTTSIAAAAHLEATDSQAYASIDCAAGLSLGEISALCFAGALSLDDGLRLVKIRGEVMQAASDESEQGMLSVLGLSIPQVHKIVTEANLQASEDGARRIDIANVLSAGNYTLAGDAHTLGIAEDLATREGALKIVRQEVAGAFHTEFMRSAAIKLRDALKDIEVKTPRIPVLSNVDGRAEWVPERIKRKLVQQVTSTVQWELCMHSLISRGLISARELGPGKVCSSIVKRIAKGVNKTVEVH